MNEHTKKTFAKAMRRRFQFIAVDEAHKIKAKDSEQAKAVRTLKARYKLLSTGTPIANYPRNIFSLLVFGWGDGTELNPYGYHNPIEQTSERGYTSGYTTGTVQRRFHFHRMGDGAVRADTGQRHESQGDAEDKRYDKVVGDDVAEDHQAAERRARGGTFCHHPNT